MEFIYLASCRVTVMAGNSVAVVHCCVPCGAACCEWGQCCDYTSFRCGLVRERSLLERKLWAFGYSQIYITV